MAEIIILEGQNGTFSMDFSNSPTRNPEVVVSKPEGHAVFDASVVEGLSTKLQAPIIQSVQPDSWKLKNNDLELILANTSGISTVTFTAAEINNVKYPTWSVGHSGITDIVVCAEPPTAFFVSKHTSPTGEFAVISEISSDGRAYSYQLSAKPKM